MTAVRQLSWVEFPLFLDLLPVIQVLLCIHDLTYSDTVTGCAFHALAFPEALLELGMVTHT